MTLALATSKVASRAVGSRAPRPSRPREADLRLAWTNVDLAMRPAIEEDLEAIRRLAPRHGIELPRLRLFVVAIERGRLPQGLPRHSVRRPAASPKGTSFAARADWETLRQSFQLVRVGDAVWVIAGGSEGALHGVGELLERAAGVIWAGVRDEDLLFGPRRPLPRGVQAPTFPFRPRDGVGPDGATLEEYVRWLGRTRQNARVHGSGEWTRFGAARRREILALYRRRGIHLILGYHAMDHFLPEKEFSRHPEWFGMRDGVRARKAPMTLPEAPHLNAMLPVQPCFSNPALVRYVSDRMAAHVRAHPAAEIFSVWPHDGINNWCQCPRCVRSSPFEHMYRLACAVAKKTPRHVPIELIAYANTLTLPHRPLPKEPRIVSMLCPYLRHYRRRVYEKGGASLVMGTLYPEPEEVNPRDDRDYGKLFHRWSAAWRRAGNGLGIFEYGGDFWFDESFRTARQRFLYHPWNRIRFNEARWYRRQGVRYFYMCGGFKAWPDQVHLLGAARAAWDCDERPEDFERRYYAAIAGNRGEALRAALGRVSEALSEGTPPDEALDSVERVLARMAPSVRVEQYRLWIRYVRLAWPAHRAEEQGRLREALEAERRVGRFCKAVEPKLAFSLCTPLLHAYTRTRQARLLGKIEGKIATDYRL